MHGDVHRNRQKVCVHGGVHRNRQKVCMRGGCMEQVCMDNACRRPFVVKKIDK